MRYSFPIALFFVSLAVFVGTWIAAPLDAVPSSFTPPSRARSTLTTEQVTAKAAARAKSGRDWLVTFTFDDGPHPIYTARLLQVLDRHGVKGAFFVNGYWLDEGRSNKESVRAVLRRAHRAGHIIGNHTYHHRLLSQLTPEEQTWEIVANEVLVSSIIGERTTLFRPPYGKMTDHATAVLRHYGYTQASWNAATDDEGNGEAIADEVLRWIHHHHGGIVLLHDRVSESVRAVELILQRLTRTNCRRLAKKLPTYQVVALDSFLRAYAESWTHARDAAAERAKHLHRLNRVCGQGRISVAPSDRPGRRTGKDVAARRYDREPSTGGDRNLGLSKVGAVKRPPSGRRHSPGGLARAIPR